METPLEMLNARLFAGLLHTIFKAPVDGMTMLELELFEVEERDAPPTMELFFLRFRGPHAPRLAQRIYALQHEKLGTLSIFLTGIRSDETGIQYEAVFNRVRKDPNG